MHRARLLSALVCPGAALAVLAGVTALAPASAQRPAPQASALSCSPRYLPLPDPVCTPGATNPDVTQGTIGSTICVPGWTARVRPPTSYTNPLKTQQIGEYGYSDTNLADYEEDHLIPLGLGGAPRDPKNLWPEPRNAPVEQTAASKDQVEDSLHSMVCAGTAGLVAAQQAIATNWRTAAAVAAGSGNKVASRGRTMLMSFTGIRGRPSQTARMTTIAGGAQMGPDAQPEAPAHELIEVRRRRAELYESITSLEHALAGPVPGRQKRWATRGTEAQEELSDDFRDHVVLMEGPEGLNLRLIRRVPRLAHKVDALTKEHAALSAMLGELPTLVDHTHGSMELGESTGDEATHGEGTHGEATPADGTRCASTAPRCSAPWSATVSVAPTWSTRRTRWTSAARTEHSHWVGSPLTRRATTVR
jgi:hypothetical protein